MKSIVWALAVFFFLVVISPVLMFAMLAPAATGTILAYWCGFVAVMVVIGSGVALYVRMETHDS